MRCSPQARLVDRQDFTYSSSRESFESHMTNEKMYTKFQRRDHDLIDEITFIYEGGSNINRPQLLIFLLKHNFTKLKNSHFST